MAAPFHESISIGPIHKIQCLILNIQLFKVEQTPRPRLL